MRRDPVGLCKRRPDSVSRYAGYASFTAEVSVWVREHGTAGGAGAGIVTHGTPAGAAACGGGERQRRVHLGDGGPDGGVVLPVSLAEVFGRLRREFLGLAEMFWPGRWCSSWLGVRTGVIPRSCVL
jgi:hypothetical protein